MKWLSYTNCRGESAVIYSHQWSVAATCVDDQGTCWVIKETAQGPLWEKAQ